MTGLLAPATADAPEIPPGYGRLRDRVVIVFGAGSVGEGWGNGKAASVAYAREGAIVIAAVASAKRRGQPFPSFSSSKAARTPTLPT